MFMSKEMNKRGNIHTLYVFSNENKPKKIVYLQKGSNNSHVRATKTEKIASNNK